MDDQSAIVRIVVNGWTSRRAKSDNYAAARRLLVKAFRRWPDSRVVKYSVTPGGFIKAPFPRDYSGERGWNSRQEDFQSLIPFAENAVRSVLTDEVLQAARSHTQYLTLGVDLDPPNQRKGDRRRLSTSAELVAIVETDSGDVVLWTGKSYPTSYQERTLVQEVCLESHLWRCGNDRVLVLGCHDLNMWSNRGWKNQNPDSNRRRRCKTMRKIARKFEPTIVLHHPHSTYSPRIWQTAWSGLCSPLQRQPHLPTVDTWVSGLAFYEFSEGGWLHVQPERSIKKTMSATSSGSGVFDVLVDGYQ